MSEEIKAGNLTAPPATVDNAAISKVMVLGIHRNHDGEILITPMDAAHDDDNRSDLSGAELAKKKQSRGTYEMNEEVMKEGLRALYEIFEQRLYRNDFRNFENFCFAIFGTNRIPTEAEKRARGKVKKMQEELV